MIELILLLNLIRTTPLQQDAVLMKIAQQRAEYLCQTQTFSHDGWLSYKSNFVHRGENIAEGYNNNPLRIHNAFLSSFQHKKVMLDKKYQYVGVGHACNITVEEFGGDKVVYGKYGLSAQTKN